MKILWTILLVIATVTCSILVGSASTPANATEFKVARQINAPGEVVMWTSPIQDPNLEPTFKFVLEFVAADPCTPEELRELEEEFGQAFFPLCVERDTCILRLDVAEYALPLQGGAGGTLFDKGGEHKALVGFSQFNPEQDPPTGTPNPIVFFETIAKSAEIVTSQQAHVKMSMVCWAGIRFEHFSRLGLLYR